MQVLELVPRDGSLLWSGLIWSGLVWSGLVLWCADDALMMHWWCSDDALVMPWWNADDEWVSYLISLNPQLFKNIAHVGSFQNFVFVFVFLCLCLCLSLCLCLLVMAAQLDCAAKGVPRLTCFIDSELKSCRKISGFFKPFPPSPR